MDHDQLTQEQLGFLATVGPVHGSGQQSPTQALSFHVASFQAACQLMGLEPVPSEQAVAAALIPRG